MIDWFFQSRHVQKLRYKMYFLDLRCGGHILILESFLDIEYLNGTYELNSELKGGSWTPSKKLSMSCLDCLAVWAEALS